MESTGKPHAVCLPFPTQGHLNPMMNLAVLLHHRGFHITFVNTHYNHTRLLNSRGAAAVVGSPEFQFRSIPDGLPPSESADATQNLTSLCLSTRAHCFRPFKQLIDDLNGGRSPDSPPVSCVIADSLMTFALQAAEEIGVPGVLFRTASACSFLCYKHIKHLVAKGLVPFEDESCFANGYLDTPIDWVPGMIPLRLRDFPSFIKTTNPEDPMLEFVITEIGRTSNAKAIIKNTFDELEHRVLKSLSTICPPIYTVGPLHLMVNQFINTYKFEWMSSSLLKQDSGCLKWLDSKLPGSVIYVNFGSIAVPSTDHLIEFTCGLVESKKNFLWIIRPDLVQGKNGLFPEYWQEAGSRGFVTGWAPQEEVLAHPAVGGFLTHCGWNSVMESLCSGVPMVCWPFFADQQVNCRYVCEEWGVGMEIGSDVRRDEVGIAVREVLDGEKGKMMKRKAMDWKRKAGEAIAPGGSSYMNLDRLVKEILTV